VQGEPSWKKNWELGAMLHQFLFLVVIGLRPANCVKTTNLSLLEGEDGGIADLWRSAMGSVDNDIFTSRVLQFSSRTAIRTDRSHASALVLEDALARAAGQSLFALSAAAWEQLTRLQGWGDLDAAVEIEPTAEYTGKTFMGTTGSASLLYAVVREPLSQGSDGIYVMPHWRLPLVAPVRPRTTAAAEQSALLTDRDVLEAMAACDDTRGWVWDSVVRRVEERVAPARHHLVAALQLGGEMGHIALVWYAGVPLQVRRRQTWTHDLVAHDESGRTHCLSVRHDRFLTDASQDRMFAGATAVLVRCASDDDLNASATCRSRHTVTSHTWSKADPDRVVVGPHPRRELAMAARETVEADLKMPRDLKILSYVLLSSQHHKAERSYLSA
jgi:hypothetical protein